MRKFLFLCTLLLSFSGFSALLLQEVDLVYHNQCYNKLPSVKEADQNLEARSDFQNFLKKAGEVANSYGLQDYLGLRLIHRHFDLRPSQVMVEIFDQYENTPSLITTPSSMERAHEKGAVPSSWIFTDSNPMLFETSTDDGARKGLEKLRNVPNFWNEMAVLIKKNNFQDLVALAILKRESLIPLSTEQIYMERNYGRLESSIVQLENREGVVDQSIRTSWAFDETDGVCMCSSHYCHSRDDGDHTRNGVHIEY
ncbi:MAG: hypothetical protein A2977_02785 [Alphaproteobacteria bacterium RIFCSPLOWO2_01_FULL_45_8]|nr:MAG: hypothetical protein A2065_03885 [Alphaproteobacteria bacterium GWB1_45_5]OFW75945.1 MAG: hypothetical protein A3K20_03935 [Alphaproteobacteria bacterium GWA1_45_9]OFW90037.1 MAG: hypothetical protein A2621_04140 [Alphaproteobacteria bacterium RIFCSPHIGHO2_01_FULL_41_14]OFW96678.1 MAG: hypothetical protein A2977_02785 [Alphaproteobacteria bacterium RIFCSPLOWO2_01_FULL_45_8]HCI49187.1 hypothetical protein [Holosporales bacterium]